MEAADPDVHDASAPDREVLLAMLDLPEPNYLFPRNVPGAGRFNEVVRGSHETKERTRGRIVYLDDVFALLPKGEIEEVDEKGKRIVLKVGKKKVRMVQEHGLWVVDAFALERFWKPLRETESL